MKLSDIFQPWSARQRRLAQSRKAITAQEFITAVSAIGGDRETAILIWDYLQDWGLANGFTPYPDDDLSTIFGIAEEELEIDLVGSILTRLSLPLPTTSQLQQFGAVDTPARIALLVTYLRHLQDR
jgi:hypothetical protein